MWFLSTLSASLLNAPWRQMLFNLGTFLQFPSTRLQNSSKVRSRKRHFFHVILHWETIQTDDCSKYICSPAHRWRSSHKIEIIHQAFLKFSRGSGSRGAGYIIPFEFPFPIHMQALKSLKGGWKHKRLNVDSQDSQVNSAFFFFFKRSQCSTCGTSYAQRSQARSSIRAWSLLVHQSAPGSRADMHSYLQRWSS